MGLRPRALTSVPALKNGAQEQVAVRVGEVCVRLWITVQGRSTLLMLMFSFVHVASGAQEQVAQRERESVRLVSGCVSLYKDALLC
ncbi:hypothetical protein J6590_072659 [Homalodisca vitripennis]|nr:hypothetical protein J6590_072659 [Homalodisca vitripennis]